MSTYRNTPDWCMSAPTRVDMKIIGVCSNDKNYRLAYNLIDHNKDNKNGRFT